MATAPAKVSNTEISLIYQLGPDVPVVVDIAVNGYIVGKMRGKHAGRRPGIFHEGIGGIFRIWEPDRGEMHAPVIGRVDIIFKLK